MAVVQNKDGEIVRMWRGNTKVDSTGNEVFVMVVLVLVAIVGVGWFSLWDAGYLGSYWERRDRGGDIKCFDTQGHSRPADNKHALCSHNAVSTPGKD